MALLCHELHSDQTGLTLSKEPSVATPLSWEPCVAQYEGTSHRGCPVRFRRVLGRSSRNLYTANLVQDPTYRYPARIVLIRPFPGTLSAWNTATPFYGQHIADQRGLSCENSKSKGSERGRMVTYQFEGSFSNSITSRCVRRVCKSWIW